MIWNRLGQEVRVCELSKRLIDCFVIYEQARKARVCLEAV